ncbi:hypothetical protein C8J57DRAFT_1234884 [Mycena rebaudengoi]|nr:hypothetical protein C8J57DRAFT_1234884 [Mycena rebaudengoi]
MPNTIVFLASTYLVTRPGSTTIDTATPQYLRRLLNTSSDHLQQKSCPDLESPQDVKYDWVELPKPSIPPRTLDVRLCWVGLPPVAVMATAVDLTGDLRPRAVSRRPVESLKKFLTGRHGQRDGRDGSTEFDTKAVLRLWDLRSTHNIVNTFPLTKTDMMQMTREKGWVRSEKTETEGVKEV